MSGNVREFGASSVAEELLDHSQAELVCGGSHRVGGHPVVDELGLSIRKCVNDF